MYGIRLGPRLSGELLPRLFGMVDAGLALVVVDGSFAYEDTFQTGGVAIVMCAPRPVLRR